ncbi:bifunctional hydroxymethylpyrimidine kinase/phosphomethylpyrimidine kinase [Aeromicrobium phragmitis]|uniref:Bifunctional hydroxymethylpyrimidine kinase/phosphomethylpyrimidine kinase n=1 Tax=Aeromicrobium phragmitis TaxID=2478914 RepID=A0A3L8PQK3_9ACTN|nr:bifunctional hydroxymethylpyrimidine kinase/phosphomethylpyrimidine kinase [Aeromicrobium phragmitis]RLV56903.1 bifunctional hydroxymethylpyrimidine kinase/phosphomethylpyrimidine kinase [Aeromicrobium phragmitis]
MSREPVMLTIAGSDPSGGAGIQADLKTSSALGVYGASVLTALTAQNTRGVSGIHAVPAAFVDAQLSAVLEDLDVRAVKIGMLGDPDVIEAIARRLEQRREIPVVLDPVMVATSGDRLVPESAVEAIRSQLVPRAMVVTPNVPETEVLADMDVDSVDDFEAAGRALIGAGAAHVLVKGGHLGGGEVVDVLVSAGGVKRFVLPRIDSANTHGTGCTLSAAIAARIALGDEVGDAIASARAFLQRALAGAVDRRYGAGHGPVDHLIDQRSQTS